MQIAILGGGLAGLTTAYFLQDASMIDRIDVYEKEKEVGGLCRSFSFDGRAIDIGPHIFFSKNQEFLDWILDIMDGEVNRLKRSTQILYKGRMVQYPFENDLSKLPKKDLSRCVEGFLNNPYRDYEVDNMLQFFLKTFGEGITNCYLRPYNEKIWKFNPSFMDTQMVERIPCPPDEDIIRSSKGETVDGYLHQLYFYYPKNGGMGEFVSRLTNRLGPKVHIHTGDPVKSISKDDKLVKIQVGNKEEKSDAVISCMPLNEMIGMLKDVSIEVENVAKKLKYNNIMLVVMKVSIDRSGDNNGFLIPDDDVAFHRMSKIDYYGDEYKGNVGATYLLEYTYRDGNYLANSNDNEIIRVFTEGLIKIGFIKDQSEIIDYTIKRIPYAYVIYDLDHKENVALIRSFFSQTNIFLNGRFGIFEYWNMDKVVEESKKISERVKCILTNEG